MGWCKLKRDDDPFGPPRHDLSLQPAGRLRRASHDVPAARQLRPEAASRPRSRSRPSRRNSAGSTTCSATASRSPASPGRRRELRFESRIRLDHAPARAARLPDRGIRARPIPFSYEAEELPDLAALDRAALSRPRARSSSAGCGKFLRQGRPTATGELLKTLTYGIKEGFAYERRSEGGTQAPLTTLNLGRGSCRDFALLMMEAVRCARPRRPLRLRLHLRARPRRGDLSRRRLDACLVPGLSAGRRLGRVRPDQRHRRQPRPDPRRGRPRPGAGRAARPAPSSATRPTSSA